MEDHKPVMFDEDLNLRVVDPKTILESLRLQEEATQFVTKLTKFDGIVKGIMNVIEAQGQMIQREKLKSIGYRNRVESEPENRKRKVREMQQLITERQTELEV
eukprot:GEZU01021681.1.p2 GENE.GEZU01021681.1~~GEZU01021681.1.p2  ORF type:complete len:103 (-),score=25.97 GEZU01021681.1:282-590(-)